MSKENTVGSAMGHLAPAFTYSTGNILVDQSTRLGLEFEFEGVGRKIPTGGQYWSLWQPKTDGSLRDNGLEFTFSTPLFGLDAENAIGWMIGEAVKNKYKTSVRTGLHVHIDVREMSPEQFTNFCLLYALVEPFLFYWADKNREESAFCVPWYYATATNRNTGAILRTLNNGQRDCRDHADGFERYAALNLNALSRFGSAEFRHMGMTLDLGRIFDWTNMLLLIKKYAVDEDKVSPALARHPEELIHTVFKRYAEKLLGAVKGPVKKASLPGQKTYVQLASEIKQAGGLAWEPRTEEPVEEGAGPGPHVGLARDYVIMDELVQMPEPDIMEGLVRAQRAIDAQHVPPPPARHMQNNAVNAALNQRGVFWDALQNNYAFDEYQQRAVAADQIHIQPRRR